MRQLQAAMRRVKASWEMVARYMLLEEMRKGEREASYAKVKSDGRAEGKAEEF